MTKTPYATVIERYKFPFEFRVDQINGVNELGPLPRAGLWNEVGTGKTATATAISLLKQIDNPETTTIVVMPPILITQWLRWLHCVQGVGKVLAYRGTPKERQLLSFEGAQFVLMSMQIFKRDYARLYRYYHGKPVVVAVDEATSVKNSGSDNHKAVRDFVDTNDAALLLLTGTPLSTPMDAFGYVRLISPTIYRNRRHFEQLHVAEKDFFDNITRWQNLDFLSDNLMLNSMRTLKKDAMPWLGEPDAVPIHYELDAAHYKLYEQLAEEQLLLLEGGGKIDATSATKLYNALQQIVVNWGHFSGEEGRKSAAMQVLDVVLDEIGARDKGSTAKLLVAGLYRMTNRYLLEYLKPLNPVAFYGEVSQTQQEKNKIRFLEDPTCQVAIIQPQSGGFGLDGMQKVCTDLIFIETPVLPVHYTQVVGRLYRGEQIKPPTVRIAIADGTIQVRLFNKLLKNDALINSIQGGMQDLRDAIYGK